MYKKGTITLLPKLRSTSHDRDTLAVNISAGGDMVGWSGVDGKGLVHAVIWQKEAIRDLGTLGGQTSMAMGCNSSGRIVGHAQTKNKEIHACLWVNSTAKDLGTFGGPSSGAKAINSGGDIVGTANTAQNDDGRYTRHAFLYRNGRMLDLNDLIPDNTAYILEDASAINDRGQIVVYGFRTYRDFQDRKFAYFLLTPSGK